MPQRKGPSCVAGLRQAKGKSTNRPSPQPNPSIRNLARGALYSDRLRFLGPHADGTAEGTMKETLRVFVRAHMNPSAEVHTE